MKIKLGILILFLISLLILSGCKADQQNGETGATVDSSTGYPPPEIPIPEVSPPGYPAPGSDTSPSTGPVRENASAMNIEVLSITPNEKNAEDVILHVKVNSSVPTNGLDEFNSNLIGQEIDIHLNVADTANLAVGNILSLTVSYRGDEWGGGYYGTGITFES